MVTSATIFVLVVFALSVNGQKKFGGTCRNINCASSQQCLGLYEPCQAGLVEGSTCGHYATCVDLDGEVKHSERVASSTNVGSVGSPSDNANTGGQLYPSLPQPDYPSYPPPNQQGGYSPPPNQQGGYSPPPNQQGGYSPPPNQQGGYYPSNPQVNPNYPPAPRPDATGNRKESSGSDSGIGSFFSNLLSGGGDNRGSSSGGNSGPGLGSLLSILGRGGNSSPASSSGSGGLDFSSLLGAITGAGGSGNSQNTRNDFNNRNPTSQNVGPNPPYNGNSGQNPNAAQDSGPSFLQSLGSFASSPLGQQLLLNALQNRNNENQQQSRRAGGLFSENPSRTTQDAPGGGSRGYPTQPPYTP